MGARTTSRTEIVVLKRGQRVIEALTAYAKEMGISNASFNAIGAVEQITCGYYDLQTRTYKFKNYPEGVFEVVSATGNIMLKEGEPFIHLHAVFTNEDNEAFGGHVEEMRVAVTLEVILTVCDTALERRYDDETGLYLITP
ncbi:DNA-binding protein [Candidatus Nomurabacteria bacterium]|nr:DNA-binding protein [Candidatus Nomurabacteria bacterium]